MERIAVRKSPAYPGLCVGCAQQQVCTYPRPHERPVFRCLEFEETSENEGLDHNGGNGGFRLGVRVRVEPERLEPGLCAECEERDGCTYPKLPGGVWRCVLPRV